MADMGIPSRKAADATFPWPARPITLLDWLDVLRDSRGPFPAIIRTGDQHMGEELLSNTLGTNAIYKPLFHAPTIPQSNRLIQGPLHEMRIAAIRD